MRNDDDIALFQEEAAELIEALESGLLELERERSDDVINRVFRAIHTIKGGAGLVGLDELAYFSHEVEHLMQHVRAGDVEPAEDVIAVLLGATDLVRMFVAENIPEESARRPILRGLHDVLAHRGALVVVEARDGVGVRAPPSHRLGVARQRIDRGGTRGRGGFPLCWG